MRNARRRSAVVNGVMSLVGMLACTIIASELYEDLAEGTEHFAMPVSLKFAAYSVFLWFGVLEGKKLRAQFVRMLAPNAEEGSG